MSDVSDVNDASEMRGGSGSADAPVVEDNGYWFGVFLVIFIVLFGTAFAALIHSLSATFGG